MYEGNWMKQQHFWLCWTLCWGEISFVIPCYLAQYLAPQAQRSMQLKKSCDSCKEPAVHRKCVGNACCASWGNVFWKWTMCGIIICSIKDIYSKRNNFSVGAGTSQCCFASLPLSVYNSPLCPDINVSYQNKCRYKYQMAWSLLTRKIKSIICKTLKVYQWWEGLNQYFFIILTTSLVRDKKVEKSYFTTQCFWCSHSIVLPCTGKFFCILCYCRD